jgi:ubiquitin-conjugating enzyme E2 variant
MANELDAAPNPLERAKIVFRAMTLLDTPIPDGHALPRAHQAAVVHGAVTMLAALAARTVVSVHTLPQAITLVLGALAGGAIGDRASAIVHHALDNYGFDQVGFLRDIAREFQAHHAEPMKVTQETWALTAFAASQFAAVPLAAALILDPGIGAGAAAGMIALVALMAQENHKMAHRPSDQVPILYDVAQLFGLSLTKGDHMAHHAIESAHADHYNVVTGTKTDDGPFFRAWERSIYRLTGVEPNSWKLDPDLKIQALGARGYDPRKEEAVEIRDRELAALKREYQQQKKLPPEQRTITSRDLRKKAEEIPDESRAAPNDAGARSIFDLRPWR